MGLVEAYYDIALRRFSVCRRFDKSDVRCPSWCRLMSDAEADATAALLCVTVRRSDESLLSDCCGLPEVLEHGGTLALAQLWRVSMRQTLVKRVLDGDFYLRPRLHLLSPVQHQRLRTAWSSWWATLFTSSRSAGAS